MKAIYYKDVCELRRILFIAWIFISYCYIKTSNELSTGYLWYYILGTCSSTAVLSGAIIGFVQTITDTQKDKWAFLWHRPISAKNVFTAKILSGLSVYIAATVIPFLTISIHMAQTYPAPFELQVVYKGLAMIACGSVSYFCGLLVAIRKRPWFGDRLLPAFILFFVLLITSSITDLSRMSISLLSLYFLITASVLAVISFAYYNKHRQISDGIAVNTLNRTFLLISLTVFFIFTGTIISSIMEPKNTQKTSIYIDSNNKPVYTKDAIDPKYGLVSIYPAHNWYPESYYQYIGESSTDESISARIYNPIIHQALLNGNKLVYWYWYKNKIVGYLAGGNQIYGYITPNGFLNAQQADSSQSILWSNRSVTSFKTNNSSLNLLFADHTLYKIDLDKHSVISNKVDVGDGIVKSINVTGVQDTEPQYQPDPDIFLFTDQSIIILDKDFNLLTKTKFLINNPNLFISFGIRDNRYVYQYSVENDDSNKDTYVITDKQGNVQSTFSPAIPKPIYKNDYRMLVMIIEPAIGYIIYPVFKRQYLYDNIGLFWISLIMTIAISIGATLYIAQIRYLNKAQTMRWLINNLIFGLAGCSLMLIVLEKRIMAECPHCGKQTNVKLHECIHCGAQWDKPEHGGIDIFEPNYNEQQYRLLVS